MASKGKDMLKATAKDAIIYYLSQLKESNYEIRDAACKAVNEIFGRVPEAVPDVVDFIPGLFESLFVITRDYKPTVREQAFNAMSQMVNAAPNECAFYAEKLVDVGFDQLCFSSAAVLDSVAYFIKSVFEKNKEVRAIIRGDTFKH